MAVFVPSFAIRIMGDVEDYDFSTGDAGASHTFPMEAGQIRVGG